MASGGPPEQLDHTRREMNVMEDRLATFSSWSDDLSPDMSGDMAKSGLFYTGQGDTVQCFCCGVSLHRWHRRDTPEVRHRDVSPTCPMVQEGPNGTADVPLYVDLRNTRPPEHTRLTTSSSDDTSGSGGDTSGSNGSGGELECDGSRSKPQNKDRVLKNKKLIAERASQCIKKMFPDDDVDKALRVLNDRQVEINGDTLIDAVHDLQKEQAETGNYGLPTAASSVLRRNSDDADDEYSPPSSDAGRDIPQLPQ